ncbi:MAG: nucleotidyltransferase family protein [Myxococcota bacterium]
MSEGTKIVGLILAAGASRRMGPERNKLILRIGDRPLLRRVVDVFRDAEVAPLFVVLGHQADAVEPTLGGGIDVIRHEDWAQGMGSSIARGVSSIEAAHHPDAFLLCVGDLPGLRASAVRSVRDVFVREGNADSIVVPTFEGSEGHPVLFGRSHAKTLAALQGDLGARKILEANASSVIRVPVADDGILRDVDTPEALGDWQEGGSRSQA